MAKTVSKPSILQQVETDLRSFLSQHQQLILNERELQLRIAQFLLNTGCYSNVDGDFVPIELKFKTTKLSQNATLPRFGNPNLNVNLTNRSAQELGRYDSWRDRNWQNNQTATAKGRPDIALNGQYPIRPWTIANIGQLNNGSNVTPVFNYTYTIV